MYFSRASGLAETEHVFLVQNDLARRFAALQAGERLVVGETAVVGNRVSILQSVTLGGTGKEDGDRHPKIGDGVLISAGAKILGNIHVGEGAKVGAGSVVLQDVPAHTTVAGVPAKVVGKPTTESPALDMDHAIPESQW